MRLKKWYVTLLTIVLVLQLFPISAVAESDDGSADIDAESPATVLSQDGSEESYALSGDDATAGVLDEETPLQDEFAGEETDDPAVQGPEEEFAPDEEPAPEEEPTPEEDFTLDEELTFDDATPLEETEDDEEVTPLAGYLTAHLLNTGELRIGLNESYSSSEYLYKWTDTQIGTDYCIDKCPWSPYDAQIRKITIGEGVRLRGAGGTGLFAYMTNLESVDLTNLDTSQCISFSSMFRDDKRLKRLNLSTWDTSKVTNMSNMFYGCTSLSSLNMKGWDTSHVTSATNMYKNCTKLAAVTVGTGFTFPCDLPEYSVNGYGSEDWWSTSQSRFYSSVEITATRKNKADTYRKSVPITYYTEFSSIGVQTYTGEAITPKPTITQDGIKLTLNTDYTLSYANNVEIGTATITVTGKGRFFGTKKLTFKIAKSPDVLYRTHVQKIGWQGWKKNGAMSGTEGQALRLEGINIKLANKPVTGSIVYRTHIQKIGWETVWKKDGAMSGTEGQALRLEAIQIELSGNMAKNYDVWYCVHAQHFGWMGWAKNGAYAGTAGYAYRLEGIKIKVLPKGSAAPGSTSTPFRDKNGTLAYKLKQDTWSFANITADVPLSFYKKCYGATSGQILYDAYNHDSNGWCFGFSSSVQAIRKYGYPQVSSFNSASNVYAVKQTWQSSALGLTARRYIAYCQIAQYDYTILDERAATTNDYAGLVDASMASIKGGNPIVIFLDGPVCNHVVVPINITLDGSTKTVIQVYDSNFPTKAQTLTLKKSGSTYTGFTYSDDKNYDAIDYTHAAQHIKRIINGGGYRDSTPKGMAQTSMALVRTTGDIRVVAGDKSFELLSGDGAADATASGDVIPVRSTDGDTTDGSRLYWMRLDTGDMKVKSLGGDAYVTVCRGDQKVEKTIPAGKSATLKL